MSTTTIPYGVWPSPISSKLITASAVSLDEVRCHSDATYWIERRPDEKGRCVIVRHRLDETEDILPAPYSARSRVHEYGGGVYCVGGSGLFFVNDTDQNIYFYDLKNTPRALTNNNDNQYADLVLDTKRQQLICICQQTTADDCEPVNSIITINLATETINTLCQGYDFYSNPRISPCGNHLSWLCWRHPDMPWDNTELWLADIGSNCNLSNSLHIDGGNSISVFQPEWSPDGFLTYVSDKTGWWNIYQYIGDSSKQLTNEDAEFGLPQWVFGQSSYTFVNKNEIICAPIKNGIANLTSLDIRTGELQSLNTHWNSFSSIQSDNNKLWFIAASSQSFPEIICFDYAKNLSKPIRAATMPPINSAYFSFGQVIEFATRNNDTAFAIYYPPRNKDVTANKDERPPLIVLSHGGPTAMSETSLDIRKQFWTSRGFAILDVNYSGSTGFGREYRQRLNNQWGSRDAEDCCDAALHMAKSGLADPKRLIIKGSSAGGYTVLCALTFYDVFSAGASYYGIGDLESLISDTHKFESRYLDHLVGPYPEEKKRYIERSPLHHVEQLNCPVIFFQGIEDKVVPKEQTEKMFSALNEKSIPVAYLSFEGEQHGFRQASTIQKTLDAELYFYCRIFGLPVENTLDLKIENLD